MKPTQEVRVMTELEANAAVLRNRTEKDEKEFQNYYATLETGGERNLARALWASGRKSSTTWIFDGLHGNVGSHRTERCHTH